MRLAKWVAAASALLMCTAAIGCVLLVQPQAQHFSSLLQLPARPNLLAQSQIDAAIKLFSGATRTDKRIENREEKQLKAEDRRASLAKKKLQHDEERLRAIMRRMKTARMVASASSEKLHLTRANYAVSLRQGYTHQLNGWYRSEDWPRAYDGSGGFDFAYDANLAPVTGEHFHYFNVPCS
jgi:hypothetical protein